MGKKLYAAYGSNLNLRHMQQCCPEAKIIGTAYIDDYELLFKGNWIAAYLTIEPKEGSRVPVAIWSVTEKNEESLDIYEECPSLYYKKEFRLTFLDRESGDLKDGDVFLYIMYENRRLASPTRSYMRMCMDGYHSLEFDENILLGALAHTRSLLNQNA